MEPRCPECRSPDIDPPLGDREEWRCRACGALFSLEEALVTFAEAETFGRPPQVEDAFTLDRAAAERALRDPDGAIGTLSPHSDAEELRATLAAAVEDGIIVSAVPGAALDIHLSLRAEPVLVVDPGVGPRLVGPSVALYQQPEEDPVAYTLRRLGRIAAEAAAVAARLRVPLPDVGRKAAGGTPPVDAWRAVCSALPGDGTVGPVLTEAEALSLTGVLAEIGERVEGLTLDHDIGAFDLTVSRSGPRRMEGRDG